MVYLTKCFLQKQDKPVGHVLWVPQGAFLEVKAKHVLWRTWVSLRYVGFWGLFSNDKIHVVRLCCNFPTVVWVPGDKMIDEMWCRWTVLHVGEERVITGKDERNLGLTYILKQYVCLLPSPEEERTSEVCRWGRKGWRKLWESKAWPLNTQFSQYLQEHTGQGLPKSKRRSTRHTQLKAHGGKPVLVGTVDLSGGWHQEEMSSDQLFPLPVKESGWQT